MASETIAGHDMNLGLRTGSSRNTGSWRIGHRVAVTALVVAGVTANAHVPAGSAPTTLAASARAPGLPAPSNDAFANATALNGPSGLTSQSIGGATREKSEPGIGLGAAPFEYSVYGYGSVWFTWLAPATGTVEFTTAGSDKGVAMSVFEGSSLGSLRELGASDASYFLDPNNPVVVPPSTIPVTLTVPSTFPVAVPPTTIARSPALQSPGLEHAAVGPVDVIAGHAYAIGVFGGDASVRLGWTTGPVATPPPNDVTPQPFPAPTSDNAGYVFGSVEGTTSGATRSPNEPSHGTTGGAHSVWYLYTAPRDQIVQFRTLASRFDTAVAVYTTGLVLLAANDDTYERSSAPAFVRVRAGEVVLVAVDGWNAEHGRFRLSWQAQASGPVNDFFRDATVINGSGSARVTLDGATFEDGDGPPQTYGGPGPGNVWFSYRSPLAGTVEFSFDSLDAGLINGRVAVGASPAVLRDLATFDVTAYPSAQAPPNRSTSSGRITVRAGEPLQVSIAGYQFIPCCYPGPPAPLPALPLLRWSFTPTQTSIGRTTAIAPFRALDTRSGAPIAEGSSRTLALAGIGEVPGSGASAVIVNLTATGAAARGYLSVTAAGSIANTSNLNVDANATAANLAIVPLSASGAITIASSVRTHVVVDVLGWVGSSGADGFTPLTPTRVLDTRTRAAGRMTAGEVIEVTAPVPVGGGVVDAYPSGSAPNTSNVNVAASQAIANLTLVKVGADGKFRVRASAATHLIGDVFGVYTASGTLSFEQGSPQRIRDDRPALSGGGSVDSAHQVVHGLGGVPSDAKAVVLNVTIPETLLPFGQASLPAAVGFAQLYPTDIGEASTSNLNFRPGADVANLAIVPIGADGRISLRFSSPVALILDVVGWYK